MVPDRANPQEGLQPIQQFSVSSRKLDTEHEAEAIACARMRDGEAAVASDESSELEALAVTLRNLEETGGAEGDRTPCLVAASHALYQVSYSPMREPQVTTTLRVGRNQLRVHAQQRTRGVGQPCPGFATGRFNPGTPTRFESGHLHHSVGRQAEAGMALRASKGPACAEP